MKDKFKKKRFTKNPLQLNDVLQSLLGNGKSSLSKGFQCIKLQKNWETIVGETIAEASYPLFINKETLYIRVEHPAWMQQLLPLKSEIISQVNHHLGDKLVAKIHLTIAHQSIEKTSQFDRY